ncbi:MAG: nuclear transport factor 2 family protein [Chloroflexi bacterium AL-W]|nr:nuclear transport factor 2 family protein [Chloroflexi bacterium AL-N1]NOK65908.1 nuclear transport factor 2 family protein [Chloroflexi bacterium AL-N10]NOK72789.1 nuclear transport factor 2 family protein [Chloroflexi bacterium AL-N5]NOK79686.1 nuclear transport factor 2 family protein [Chloroflexi bacterium AL-W]NOK93011.1 nuclear transport factor 2 family protein [Chloroflexi bacterium AL-N15]
MTTISRSKDYGNSPKNKFAEDIVVALEVGDLEFLKPVLDSAFVWNMTSESALDIVQFQNEISSFPKPSKLDILHVITHRKSGAVNGVSNFSQGQKYFCHVIEFTNTKCNKIAAITSYAQGT